MGAPNGSICVEVGDTVIVYGQSAGVPDLDRGRKQDETPPRVVVPGHIPPGSTERGRQRPPAPGEAGGDDAEGTRRAA